MNKPYLIGCIIQWMLILLEFDFIITIRQETTHILANHMSWIPNGVGVEHNLPNAPLFLVDIVPKWAKEICHYLANRLLADKPIDIARARWLIWDTSPHQLIVG